MEPQRQDIQKLTTALRDHAKVMRALAVVVQATNESIANLAEALKQDEEEDDGS